MQYLLYCYIFLLATYFIKPGKKFGGTGGSKFNDSKSLSLTLSHYLSGIVVSENLNNFDACQFIYTLSNDNQSRIYSKVHGNEGKKLKSSKEYYLNDGERIVKVQVKIDDIIFSINGNHSHGFDAKLIGGLNFITNKGRSFPSEYEEDDDDDIESEDNRGYIIGYVAGKAGLSIDQLQFYWYPA